MSLRQRVVSEFERRFNAPPHLVVRSPGRVNLIGEHTDYNAGFVLPMAIDRAIWIALRPRADRSVNVYSLDFAEPATFVLDALENTASGWAEYLRGVAGALQEAGYTLRGWEGVVAGDVPVGAGLSSSAALELATKGVRVNAVNPGVTVTELHRRGGMDDQAYQAFLERSKTTHPIGRVGEAKEIAELILFLASPHAGWITGVTYSIDGGRAQTCAR